jgi:hypothetical protein
VPHGKHDFATNHRFSLFSLLEKKNIIKYLRRMLYNVIAVSLIVEDNMNSKENGGNNQSKAEVKVDIGLNNDNQSMDQGPPITVKTSQLENRTAAEQLRLNNNSGENNIKLMLPSKTSAVFSNGTKPVQAPMPDSANSLEQTVSQDVSNVNISSVFTSTANIKPQTANTNAMCQLKHKTVMNTSTLNLPKSQMHLNLSSTQTNMHLNHDLASVVHNSTATTSAIVHSSISTLNTSLMSPNLSTIKSNDDIDMKNNVDYLSAIEKCPSKVSCSSDSSPEADCSWTSKSYGSKRILNNISGSSIGSTSQGTCCFLRPNINGSREIAGPSGLQRVSFCII